MSTLIDNPAGEWVSNEVYEIQATDKSEGASVSSSFGGIGLSNQPHQQLANRTAFLKNRQDINITNITILQAFKNLFVGTMAPNGDLKLPAFDTAKGLIEYVIQWGTFNAGAPYNDGDQPVIPWNMPFPNVCVNGWVSRVDHSGTVNIIAVGFINGTLTPTQGRVAVTAGPAGGNIVGISWITIGY